MSIFKESSEKAVRDCLGLKSGEKFVLIYDNAAVKIAASVINVAEGITNGNSKHFCMENYGKRTVENPLQFPEEMKKALENADASFFMRGRTVEGEAKSFTIPMIEAVESNDRLRHAHSPNIREDVFLSGMAMDYNSMREFTKKVNSVVKEAKTIRVTTPAGTDFTAELGYRWVISDGFIHSGRWGNIPGAETFTCPKNLEGKIIVDGVLGTHFDKYGILEKNPLKIKAKGGRITSLECLGNEELEEDFKKYIAQDKNANRFGELGIGTNIGLKKLLGNMLHDEKFPGVHVAVGHPYPKETGAKWDSEVHCDMVMQQCSIYVDGRQIMADGKYDLDLLPKAL